MLIKLSVENFKSFHEPIEFTMIESNKYRDKVNHKIRVKNVEILKHAVIYGANASGKSNLIEVFKFIQYCIRYEIPAETVNSFCKIFEENKQKPSKFEIQFSINEKVYAYGFSVILHNRHIQEEWLYELTSSSSIMIFERTYGSNIEYGKALLNDADEANRLRTYSQDLIENKICLFLREMNRNKKFAENSLLNIFSNVYEWLTKNIIIMTPTSMDASFEYFYDDTSIDKVNKIISTFDTGISKANIIEIGFEDLQNKLPKEALQSLYDKLQKLPEGDNKPHRIAMRSRKDFISIDIDSERTVKITTLNLKHGNSFFDFSFAEESDGTRRIFDILDMLLIKEEDVVFIVDELERSLHPKLTQRFLSLFSEMHSERKMQLIFTTHESSIMDQALFRRDEFWFVERDQNNISKIYSLDIFKERYDKKLSKAYLEGRYGAIPVFQKFDFEE